ncbi:MAG: hypothetical protein F9K29_07920 [Hyphomicrobiaceae bacterium]|nr:MAG: hypothetical protein F9K29_07920 [Hyphomicrobiaceae bacterium]
MADTIEKRVADLEQILAHLPQDLDARFAGADARAGARFDRLNVQLQALKAEVQQGQVATAGQIAALDRRIEGIESKIDELLARLGPKP